MNGNINFFPETQNIIWVHKYFTQLHLFHARHRVGSGPGSTKYVILKRKTFIHRVIYERRFSCMYA